MNIQIYDENIRENKKSEVNNIHKNMNTRRSVRILSRTNVRTTWKMRLGIMNNS